MRERSSLLLVIGPNCGKNRSSFALPLMKPVLVGTSEVLMNANGSDGGVTPLTEWVFVNDLGMNLPRSSVLKEGHVVL